MVLPQASVAVAVPSAPFIEPADGLQPNAALLPPVVRLGGVASAVHVAVRAAVVRLPQASTADHVLVRDLPQPLLIILPSDDVNVAVPQLSEALAVPRAPLISPADGLHPSVNEGPPVVITAGVLSKHGLIWKGGIKSFRSAVGEAEDFVFIKSDLKGKPEHWFGTPPPSRAVTSIAASMN